MLPSLLIMTIAKRLNAKRSHHFKFCLEILCDNRGRKVEEMNIRRQLALSNLMMILVPVLTAILALLGCLAMLWFVVQRGSGMGVDDVSDFNWLSRMAVSYVGDIIDGNDIDTSPDPLVQLLDANTMYLTVSRNGDDLYKHGTEDMFSASMLEAARAIDSEEVILSSDGRSLYLARLNMDDGNYEVSLFAKLQDMETRAFRVAAVMTWLVLAVAILLSVYLTSHFVSKALLRRISMPLDELSKGAEALGEGNLDYRIDYRYEDEFTPLCRLFNEMAAKLRSLIESTQKDEESRKELIAGISHDLRSPLTSIQAYVEGLEDGVATTAEMRARYLSVIKAKVHDIDSLVSQLFLFSKLELNDYPVTLSAMDIADILRIFAETHGPDFAQRGLDLIIPDENVRGIVSIDGPLFERVLVNVAENSLRYRKREKATLWLATERKDHSIVITLEDDGPGVGKDDYDRLFEVFYRTDKARRDPAKGSGLGLAISKKMIEHMGGTINAEKSSHGGLAIVITLKEDI